ncbi:elongin-A3-like [Marmota flaviventris]|uniref:elongin-A3-like n=1 Tax=Marmota flaviventris TaxID=93162 RepID=UPI003A88600A
MASEEVLLRAVGKLQGRLATRTRPDKLQKYLQQLSALPLTPHILQETGVRKMVKSLRHHELLGGLARDLAARWKKLALLEVDPGRAAHDSQLAKEITDSGSRENSRAPSSPSRPTGHGPQKHRDLEESPRPRERREDRSKKRPPLAALPAPWRSWDGCPAQASGGPTGPHPMSREHSASPEDTEPSARGRVPVEGQDRHFQATTGLPRARPLQGPRGKHDLLPKARETDDDLEDANDGEPEEEFLEAPTMSFEAYLTYDDQPRKKKRKVKTSAKARKAKASKRSSQHLDSAENFPPLVIGKQSAGPQPAQGQGSWAGMQGVSREAAAVLSPTPSPSLWDPPSPPPEDDDALMSFFAPNATALSSPQEEEEAGFTGIRTNSRTPVYSGGKRGRLAQTTWLPRGSQGVADQDSLWEERALPHSLFGSALEKCTPEQLSHAEGCHQGTAEETDQLWRLHCGQEFKGETPKENESWREMYLRLQDAREQRLQALTSKIRSRHPQEPRGPQTKMVYFKSPGEVPARHGQFGTLAAAASGRPNFQPAQHPRGGSDTPSSTSSNSSNSSSSFDARSETAAEASGNPVRAHRPAPVANTRKPKAKEIPPLLAKTLKDYRRLISRR